MPSYEKSFLGPYVGSHDKTLKEARRKEERLSKFSRIELVKEIGRVNEQLKTYSSDPALTNCPNLKKLITRLRRWGPAQLNGLRGKLPLAHAVAEFLRGVIEKNTRCKPMVAPGNQEALLSALNKKFHTRGQKHAGAFIGILLAVASLLGVYNGILGLGGPGTPKWHVWPLLLGLIGAALLFGYIGGRIGKWYSTRKQQSTVRGIMTEMTDIAKKAKLDPNYDNNPQSVAALPSSKPEHINTHTAASRGFSSPIPRNTSGNTQPQNPDDTKEQLYPLLPNPQKQ